MAAGSILLAVVLAGGDLGAVAGPSPLLFWIFAAMLGVSEARRGDSGELTVSWALAGALLLLSPSPAVLGVLALAHLVGALVRDRCVVAAAHEAARATLSFGAGALVLHLLQHREALLVDQTLSLAYLPSTALAGATVWGVSALLGRRSATDGLFLSLAPIFAAVGQRSVLLVPMLLLVSYVVRRSARLALTHEHQATHDGLTDLPNRRLFLEEVERALCDGERRNGRLAVVLLDLDGFKEINDRLGHSAGDLVLTTVGARLRDALRPSDLVARLGGDEFAVLLRGVTDATAARRLADGLLLAVAQPSSLEGLPLRVGASLGVALYPDHADDVRSLIEHADVAMYQAKRAGGGVALYVPNDRRRAERGRLALLGELQAAIAADQLVLHYQPKVDLRSGRVVGVEALVRWLHPRHGLIPPEDFLPIAEHTELAGPLTQHLLRKALTQCAAWQREGIEVPVAVNLSARNLHDLRFPRTVAQLLAEVGLEPSWLELELTENTVMADPTRTTTVLAELSAMGVSLAIDDFGTGYSSLGSLRDLPVHSVKIDRSFVGRMTTSRDDGLIVRSIIELARNLGLRTIAEGVEDDRTWRVLESLGCDVVQGHILAPPAHPDAVAGWFHTLDALQVAPPLG